MAKCIIHAGMHKTGSTSIQSALKNLDDGKFRFGRLGQAGNHSIPFAVMFARSLAPFRFSRKFDIGEENLADMASEFRQSLTEQIEAADGRTVIFSGEGIALLSESEVAAVREVFEARSCTVEIVAYIRPPGSFMSSSMQQRLMVDIKSAPDPAKYYPRYRERFEKFDTVFGAANVSYFKFDPKRFPNQDVVDDFCGRLGIDMEGVAKTRKNDSRPKAQLLLLYQYKKMQDSLGLPRLKIGDPDAWDFLADLDRSKFRISPDLVRPILDANAADTAWMERRLGESLAEDLGQEAPGDFRGEADLLEPLPGARERFTARLRELDGGLPGDESLDLYQLMSRWAGHYRRYRSREGRGRRRGRG